jgi:hypothetical protein
MRYLVIYGSPERKVIELQLLKTPSTLLSNDTEMSSLLVQPQVEHSIFSVLDLCIAAPNMSLTVKRAVHTIDATCPRAFLTV